MYGRNLTCGNDLTADNANPGSQCQVRPEQPDNPFCLFCMHNLILSELGGGFMFPLMGQPETDKMI